MKLSTLRISCLGSVFAALSLSATAATQVFTDSASFLSSLESGSYTNTFSTSSVGPSFTGGAGNAFTFTLVSGVSSNVFRSTDGYVQTGNKAHNLTITFNTTNITAVGANFFHVTGTTLATFSPTASVTVTLNDGTTQTYTPTSSVVGSYRGFASTTGTHITQLVYTSFSGTYAALDNLTVGVSAIPEPSTYATIAGLGMLGLVAARRRRRAA